MANARPFVEGRLNRSKIVVFSKVYSPEGRICEEILKEHDTLLPSEIFEWINIEKRSDCPQVEDYLWLLSGKNNREVPLLFVKHRCVGGYDEILQMHNDGTLSRLLKTLTLEDEDSDDEEFLVENAEACQVTVRIEEVDDTELLIRVRDSFSDSDYHADYNRFEKKATSEVHELFKQAQQEREQAVVDFVTGQEINLKVPIWLPVTGTLSRLSIAMNLSTETSRFVMTKTVEAEVVEGANLFSQENENVAASDPTQEAGQKDGAE
ncbi:hypothetical protein BsWGS_25457 [Bradybaena similaris]